MIKGTKDFKIGEKYRVNGMPTPLHNEDIVIVVDPETEYKKALKEGKRLEGNILWRRPGLIPCFNLKYPETLWWWFAPVQLQEKID